MTDEASRILQRNEKTKAFSTVITNLGTALVASAFGRLWFVGLDPWVILWGVPGCFVILSGTKLLDGLEAES